MKKERLAFYQDSSLEVLAPGQSETIQRPIASLEHGDQIIDEIYSLSFQREDQILATFLQELTEGYGEKLMSYVAVKFGIVTSCDELQTHQVMQPQSVAQRILERHRFNPQEFRNAFLQVLEEEIAVRNHIRFFDLESFEEKTRAEIEEMALLSGNPALRELLEFTHELNTIFEERSFLFSYLEHRYSEYFQSSHFSPQQLALQITLDFLSYRENFQLGIIADYEKLMEACGPAPIPNQTNSVFVQ